MPGNGLDFHAYEVSDRPGTRLVIGQWNGEQLPAMKLVIDRGEGGFEVVMLSRFPNRDRAQRMVEWLDSTIDQINRVVAFYKSKYGDDQ